MSKKEMSKSDLLLNEVIREFIKHKEPIGSQSLKISIESKMGIAPKLSTATIRNYFKDLVDKELLSKSHVSSGRLPTYKALKGYWRANLSAESKNIISLKKLEDSSHKFDICSVVCFTPSNTLEDVVNFGNSFLLLCFTHGKIALEYSKTLERFSTSLKGMELSDIKKIAYDVKASDLFTRLKGIEQDRTKIFCLHALKDSLQYSDTLLLEISSGEIFHKISYGIHFDEILPSGYLALLSQIRLDGESGKLLCLGALDRDFETFYDEIAI